MDTQDQGIEQNQYLTFRLAEEEFGVGILQVKEILEYGGVTSVPMVPDFIKGVINLRGNVVPVMDLKARFQMQSGELDKRACVVIVEVNMNGEETVMGILVDAVSEVMEIPPQDIEPPPPFGSKVSVDFIKGMAKVDKQFTMLLDIDKILSEEELAVVGSIQAENLPETLEAASV